jgi:uncharacterized protein YkwD
MATQVIILLAALALSSLLALAFTAHALAAPRSPAASRSLATRPRAHADHQLSPASCPGANDTAASASERVIDDAVACLINHERETWGLPRLEVNSHLDTAAHYWSRWMVSHEQFDHARLASRISAAGYDWEEVGENIATGYATPMAVVRAWLASPSHCQNVLDPDFRAVGTGVVDRPVPGMASSGSTWTQDFGLAMRQSSPSDRQGPQDGCPYTV